MLSPYIAYSEAECLIERERLKAERTKLISSQSLLSASVGGKSFSYMKAQLRELDNALVQVMLRLQQLNPTAHGKGVTETYANFNGALD